MFKLKRNNENLWYEALLICPLCVLRSVRPNVVCTVLCTVLRSVLRSVLPNAVCNVLRYVLPNVVCNVLRYELPNVVCNVLCYVLPNVVCNVLRYVLPNVVCDVLRCVFLRRLKCDQKEKVPTPVLHCLYVTASICTLITQKNVFMCKSVIFMYYCSKYEMNKNINVNRRTDT